MAESTGIGWCDATFNPWVGCSKVSPGCAHCYAETLVTGRMGRPGTWGDDGVRERTSESNWRKPLRWNQLAADGRLPDGSENPDGHRPRVFCASLADVFEPRDEVAAWRLQLLRLIDQTPNLDWLILTKRPEYARDWLHGFYICAPSEREWTSRDDIGWGVFPNVWVGTSIENARFTWRADALRQIPAAVRFISAEPLLGSLYPKQQGRDFQTRPLSFEGDAGYREREPRGNLDLTGIDWVIVGGESGGRDARPMHPDWAREIRDAVLAEGERRFTLSATCPVPVECHHGYDVCPICDARPALFFKQWGSYQPTGTEKTAIAAGFGDPASRAVAVSEMEYVGASPKAGGKLLDGSEWCEFPAPTPVAA